MSQKSPLIFYWLCQHWQEKYFMAMTFLLAMSVMEVLYLLAVLAAPKQILTKQCARILLL